MIGTVTMNPSVDIRYDLSEFKLDAVNRVESLSKTAGGKGLNVARVATQLGQPVVATGILGGKLGEYISEQLDLDEIHQAFLHLEEKETRNCIAILHDQGIQTEVLEQGPTISQKEKYLFLAQLNEVLKTISTVTLSGSLPKGLPEDFYSEVIKHCQEYNVKALLDTSGVALKAVLEAEHKPYLIKPNLEELIHLMGHSLEDEVSQIKKVLSSDLFEGIPYIVVTRGKNGSVAKVNGAYYQIDIPKVEVVNPVGSGDATVAGLAIGILNDYSAEMTLKYGMTAGVLNAMHPNTGHVKQEAFQSIYHSIRIKQV